MNNFKTGDIGIKAFLAPLAEVIMDSLRPIISDLIREGIETLSKNSENIACRDELLTPDDVAAMLKVSKNTVWNLRNSKRMSGWKQLSSKEWRISLLDVHKFLDDVEFDKKKLRGR